MYVIYRNTILLMQNISEDMLPRGSNKSLLPSNPVFYPKCDRCRSKERQKIAKREQVVSSDLGKSKKQKTIV